MPRTLRRSVVLALSLCALAVSGISPAAASVDLGRAKPIAAHHTSKKKVTVCDKAAQLRRAVIKKYVKQYTRQFGKKKGKAMGRDKPGRDICRFGLRGGKKPSKPGKVRYYWTLHRLRYPPPPPPAPTRAPVSSGSPVQGAAPQPTKQTHSASAGSAAGSTMSAIAKCESGSNPATNTGNGYYGKYQFTLSTWQSVGGSGLPSNASEAEQDRRAAMLYAQKGSSPWPVCGR
jgi:hypothetical protein